MCMNHALELTEINVRYWKDFRRILPEITQVIAIWYAVYSICLSQVEDSDTAHIFRVQK